MNWQIKNELKSLKESSFKNYLLPFGILIFGLIVLSFFLGFRINTKYTPSLNKYDTARQDFALLHVKLEEISHYSKQDSIYIKNKIQSLQKILTSELNAKSWDDFIISSNSPQIRNLIKGTQTKLTAFKKVIFPKTVLKPTPNRAGYFYDILNNLKELKQITYLHIRNYQNILEWVQIILLLVFALFAIIMFIYLKKQNLKRLQLLTNQKIVLDKLAQNNSYLKEAQTVAQLGDFSLNIKTLTFTSSEVYDDILGINDDDLKSVKVLKKIMHPDDYETQKLKLVDCVYNNKNYESEYRVINKNTGQLKWLFTQGKIINELNEPAYFLGTIQDITKRKRYELALLESQQDLLNVQEAAKLGSYKLNLNTQKGVCSAIYEEITGLQNQENISFKDWQDLVYPDDLAKNEKILENIIKTGARLNHEYRIISKDSHQLKWIHGVAEIVYNNGKPNYLVGTIQDITERKDQEEALLKSKKRLIESQEITRLGTFEFDDESKLFESSSIFDEIVGIDTHYIKDLSGWINLVHPEDKMRIFNLLNDDNLLKFKEEFKILNKKNKKTVWVLGYAKKEFNSKGNRIKVVGTIQDITERKLAEIKIKQSDAILNKIDSLVLVIDNSDNVIYASPSTKTVLGYEPNELLGQGWWQLTYSDKNSAEKIKMAVHNYLFNNGKKTQDVAFRKIKTKNGDFKIIEWHISKNIDNSYINIGIDVTKDKEKDLRFKKLTETANSAIILSDKDGNIIEWNNAAKEIFGYKHNEIIGSSIHLIIPEKYQKLYDKLFARIQNKNHVKVGNVRSFEGLSKQGRCFPIEISLTSWQSQGKAIFCAFINDITEQKRHEKRKEVIFNITKMANVSYSLEDLFNFTKSELGKLINTNNFFIALYDKTTDMISTPYKVDEHDYNNDFPKGKTLTGYIIDTKKSLVLNEVALLKLINTDKLVIVGTLCKCWLGVPLMLENECIGAIVIQSYTDENAYTQKDVELIELTASNISQVINRLRDFEKINLLNQALIQSPEAVVVTNFDGDIEYVNPAFTTLSGFTEHEVLGKNPRILKSGEQKDSSYKNLWETLISGQVWEGELINKRKDGSKYLIEANISSVKNENGIISHFIAIEEDITEKRKLERDFINAFVDAQELEKQSFGEDLHDGISQILTAESMYIELLLNINNNENYQFTEFLSKIRELNLSAITDARGIAHGLMSKQLKEYGLLKAVEIICEDYNNSRNIEFIFEKNNIKEGEISKEIKIQLYRITQEISTNIIRHSGATKAMISLKKVNLNQLELLIKDNGVGINVAKINKEKGAGIKNIERRVKLLNGKIEIVTETDKCTCYTIVVPLIALY